MYILIDCGCNMGGTEGDSTCDTSGQCNCVITGYEGLTCSTCESGFYEKTDEGFQCEGIISHNWTGSSWKVYSIWISTYNVLVFFFKFIASLFVLYTKYQWWRCGMWWWYWSMWLYNWRLWTDLWCLHIRILHWQQRLLWR